MSRLDFHVDFYSEVENMPVDLEVEANERLAALAKGHKDMIGASVGLDEVTGEETPHAYEARVVAYIKPDNIAATEQSEALEAALENALDALERQVREHRERLRDVHRQPREFSPPVPDQEAS
ncbi:MAG: HPF/RaiA family ribosome-associated protein [Anaerolineae bacterium]